MNQESLLLLTPLKTEYAAILHLDSLYRSYGVEGCFALYNLKKRLPLPPTLLYQGFLRSFLSRSQLAYRSDLGDASPEDTIFWDGRELEPGLEPRQPCRSIPGILRALISRSPEKIGVQRMREWTTRSGYGQLDIKDDNIDTFWLEGDSRVTPLRQVSFLVRLYREQLPFQRNATHRQADHAAGRYIVYKLYGKDRLEHNQQ